MKRSPVSCARAFEKRGDPWMAPRESSRLVPTHRLPMTPKEARIARITGRAALTPLVPNIPSDPDLDAHLRAKRAKLHFEKGPDTLPKKNIFASKSRRIASIRRKMNAASQPKEHVVKAASIVPEPERQTATVPSGFSVYVRTKDGTETETDWRTEKIAMTVLQKRRRNKDVECVEVWSYATGELIATYNARPGRVK